MEKTEKLQTIAQISISITQSLQNQTPKRQSMRKRLSAQKSIQDFFKTYSNDLQNQKNIKADILKAKKDKKCFEIKNLVDLSKSTLNKEVGNDPFLRKGLKFLAKEMKQNKPQNKNIEEIRPHYFDSSRTSYKNYQNKVKAKQTEMLQKVINSIGKDKFYA